MKHHDARILLDEYAAGMLEDSLATAVGEHLDVCPDCADWLLARELIGTVVSHVDSESLATYAQEPSDLPIESRDSIQAHLGECRDCRHEYRLTQRALIQARADSIPKLRAVPLPAPDTWWRPALGVAAAVFLLLTILLTVGHRGGDQEDELMSGLSIEDSREVQARGRLTATNVEVLESASLTLRAEESVVLGEGFSVKPGGELVIAARGRNKGI